MFGGDIRHGSPFALEQVTYSCYPSIDAKRRPLVNPGVVGVYYFGHGDDRAQQSWGNKSGKTLTVFGPGLIVSVVTVKSGREVISSCHN